GSPAGQPGRLLGYGVTRGGGAGPSREGAGWLWGRPRSLARSLWVARRRSPAGGELAGAACGRAAGARGPWGGLRGPPPLVRTPAWRSAGLDHGAGGGPYPHDDPHRGAPGRTAGGARWRRGAGRRLARAGLAWPDQRPDGRERDGPRAWRKPPCRTVCKPS